MRGALIGAQVKQGFRRHILLLAILIKVFRPFFGVDDKQAAQGRLKLRQQKSACVIHRPAAGFFVKLNFHAR